MKMATQESPATQRRPALPISSLRYLLIGSSLLLSLSLPLLWHAEGGAVEESEALADTCIWQVGAGDEADQISGGWSKGLVWFSFASHPPLFLLAKFFGSHFILISP
jgi:hypothetical protein